ncbi:hypothetical protein BH23GEM8_BH23GEM8_14560 [soil metagenome]
MLTTILASGLLSWGILAGPIDAVESYSFDSPSQEPEPLREFYDSQRQDFDESWDIRARIWVDGDRAFHRVGDRLRIRFSTSEDAHVALIHVDPDGRLDFLYPANPWDSDYVRGGRYHSLPLSSQGGLTVRTRTGIGYIFMIASPIPLDYRHFSRGRNSPWDWSYAGRNVNGDPFWAMEQISRILLPGYGPFATDYYSYHVEGRHRYPTFACSDRYGSVRGGWGWSSSYGSCSRQDLFLRRHPDYYDSRLYRGDRRVYIARTYGLPPAQHRFKEPAVGSAPDRAQAQPRFRAPQQTGEQRAPENVNRAPAATDRAGAARGTARQPERAAEPRQASPTTRERPTLERRSPQRENGTQQRSGATQGERRPTPPPAAQPAARAPETRESPPARAEPRPEPRPESQPASSTRNRRPPGGDS